MQAHIEPMNELTADNILPAFTTRGNGEVFNMP